MKRIWLIVAVVCATALNYDVFAQAKCGNELIHAQAEKDPHIKAYFDEYFAQYDAENKVMAENRALSKGTENNEQYVIPVVFHIVLSQAQIDQLGGTPGIIERINSQLIALNEDFSASNADISGVPTGFTNLVGNANMRFELAKVNPEGKAQAGILYRTKPATFSGYAVHDEDVKNTAAGGSSPWDITQYINIWITRITPTQGGGQVLGYGYNPVYAYQVYKNTDLGGIVLHYLTLGKRTSTLQQFHGNATKGRTLTHEMGHFFNIWHIWGKTTPSGSKNCNEDDGIDDTPLQEESNTTCPNGIQPNCWQSSYPSGEMYMNFMDYSSDVCTKMFSKGQVDRMRTELSPSGTLPSLANSKHLAYWPSNVSVVEYNNKVELLPNPSNGKFNVTMLEKYNRLNNIIVTNTVGQMVQKIDVTDQSKINYEMDLSNMAKGIYIVQLGFDEGVISRKVVIQ